MATLQQLRRVLELEQRKRCADTAVVGGLDRYLLRFVQEAQIPEGHEISRILRKLPTGGYRALNPITRQRFVQMLLAATAKGFESRVNPAQTARPVPSTEDRPAQAPAAKKAPPPVATLDSPVTVLPGATRGIAQKLASPNVGVRTVRDLLFLAPHRYDEYLGVRSIASLEIDKLQTVVGRVVSAGTPVVKSRKVSEAIVSDGTGSVRVIWWTGPWIAKKLQPGARLALMGRTGAYRQRLQLETPEFVSPDDPSIARPALLPVYPSTAGLDQRTIRRLVRSATDRFLDKLTDPLPPALRQRLGLLPLEQAVLRRHFPETPQAAEAARRRMAFDELLAIEIGVMRRRSEWEAAGGARSLGLPPQVLAGFEASLPFALTDDQKRAIGDVLADLAREVPMSRLLEGDVGTGKTVVAAAALLAAVTSGYQGAVMAPTEILAEQLFRTFCRLFDPSAAVPEDGANEMELRPAYLQRPLRIALLRGSQKASVKGRTQRAIGAGQVHIAVGTHALIQEQVEFDCLALAVVDEQHRFGVQQRAALRGKGGTPHVLVMTATPIPRTLQLTVYGDLDVSVLRQMPDNRPPVKTWRVWGRRAREAYEFLRRKVTQEGKQAYIICPLVEESEVIEAKAAVQEYERLSREVFPELRLGLLHGRMSAPEKDAVMRAFRDHELDILVSTAVVEVGIDVPNATVMLIEGADRFGLAQLHQFRGRVRRSSEQAYCFLVSENLSAEADRRLSIMESVSDGFQLAEYDLEIRGPGEYFGTRQSGVPALHAARLSDVELVSLARQEAMRLLQQDPALSRPEHTLLRAEVEKVWGRLTAEAS